MIKIKIESNRNFSSDYIVLVKKFYAKYNAFDYFLNDIKAAMQFCSANKSQEVTTISAYKKQQLCGHIALISKKKAQNSPAFFGFFECENNQEGFDKLWENLIETAQKQNIQTLIGPVDGAIWFPYRVISSDTNENYFPSEPLSQTYYVDFLRNKKPVKELVYHSAYRQKYDAILNETRKSLEICKANNLKISQNNRITPEILFQLYELSTLIFSSNPAYTPISFDEFTRLYSAQKIEKYITALWLAYSDDNLVGFCSNMLYDNSLIMKTIGIHPDYQKKGIASAMIYQIHKKAQEENLQKIIYALVRKDNRVKHFTKENIQVFREYSAFVYVV